MRDERRTSANTRAGRSAASSDPDSAHRIPPPGISTGASATRPSMADPVNSHKKAPPAQASHERVPPRQYGPGSAWFSCSRIALGSERHLYSAKPRELFGTRHTVAVSSDETAAEGNGQRQERECAYLKRYKTPYTEPICVLLIEWR
jgi:hypothetical protein